MKLQESNSEARHPIRIVTSRTKIPPDVLRAWERRYTAVAPQRSETGRRLYSDQDIEKLRLLKRVVDAGRRISDVASLSIGELKALIEEDKTEGPEAVRAISSLKQPLTRKLFEAAMSAVENLDRQGLERILGEASINLTGPALRGDFIAPLLERIGERWREGSIRIAHEHLAAALTRSHLGNLRAGATIEPNAPRLVITTPAGERHELGALLAASAATELGWDVEFLGPDLPAEEIAAAALQENVRVVALSLVYSSGAGNIPMELRKLRELLGSEMTILLGGRAAPSHSVIIEEIDALLIRDLRELPQILEDLAG
jgi:methylmalonyl-CoA mutase cobalamin-binding domain/chain